MGCVRMVGHTLHFTVLLHFKCVYLSINLPFTVQLAWIKLNKDAKLTQNLHFASASLSSCMLENRASIPEEIKASDGIYFKLVRSNWIRDRLLIDFLFEVIHPSKLCLNSGLEIEISVKFPWVFVIALAAYREWRQILDSVFQDSRDSKLYCHISMVDWNLS